MQLISKLFSHLRSEPVQQDDQQRDLLLDRPLMHLTERDAWTLRDAVSGTVIFGGPGSGKSSGPGKHIAMACLTAGMGGMALCAKPGEAQKWLDYAVQAGRRDDVTVFSPDYPEIRFNPLDYELRRGGRGSGYTQNVTALFKFLLEVSEGGKKDGKDPFWDRAVVELLTYAVDVLHAAGEAVSLLAIYQLIQSCPRRSDDIDEFYSDEWRESSYCWQCLSRGAGAGGHGAAVMQDLEMAANYLCEEFPRLAEKTRTSILASFKGMALPFLRSPMREIFGADTTLRLEDTFERGQILIIDYPIREFAEVGRIVGAMMKHFFQAAVERRVITEDAPPCFLFVDECQEFITSHDSKFMATARESRCCTVFITQNISNLYAAVKATSAKFVVDALLANFMTKIFAANADALTNEWAAKVIAQSWQMKAGSSMNTGQQTSMGSSTSQQLAYQVLPAEFTMLQKGGPPAWMVETVLFQGGRLFNTTGATYARVGFPQTS